MAHSRRTFLAALAGAAVATRPVSRGRLADLGPRLPRTPAERAVLGLPDARRHWRGVSSVGASDASAWQAPEAPRAAVLRSSAAQRSAVPRALAAVYPDLRRRFIFEYYPWYDTDPWYHWNEGGRTPPIDIAATSMPRLGPYDSYDLRVIEQHARWIANAGVGAVNLSWWGRGDYTDLAVPRVMDVMRDHDIKVTFHLEPYRDDRAWRYHDDIRYLLREYGERRRWDALLLLDDGRGRRSPVFKSFRTILPREVQDCHGRTFLVPDYTPDGEWRRQTDGVREEVRRDFAEVHLLADSLDMGRTAAAGFDGIAVYDNFVTPAHWRNVAEGAAGYALLFSFNVNPGFDGYPPRVLPPPGSCYTPQGFEPGGSHPDWWDPRARVTAQRLALERITESFSTTVSLQQQPTWTNGRRGFFLTYINSFNEWHEGHQFEPARDAADLTPDERRIGYHNPPDGSARLTHLAALMGHVSRTGAGTLA